jgi:hypothetical protein
MNLYLAGLKSDKNRAGIDGNFKRNIYVLESFYYMEDWMHLYIKNHWNFLLDSGAFTFMNSQKNANINWDNYVNEYADFINKLDIKLFFELDIDAIVGIKEVERLRTKLEHLTGKKCIPVWHKSRGLDYYKQMCINYDYIAIGGLVTKEIKTKEYPIFTELLKIAKANNCKVHALGFTSLKDLKKYKFHSVDSTAWLYGNIGGFVFKFNGAGFNKYTVQKGKRINGKKVAINNFNEWVKFQKYAKQNL